MSSRKLSTDNSTGTAIHPSKVVESLRESALVYVALDGYRDIREQAAITILTEDTDKVARVLGLTRVPGQQRPYSDFVKNECPGLRMTIYQKGHNVFPERFESGMLRTRIIDRMHPIHVPDMEHMFWMHLYRFIVHEGQGTAEFRSAVLPKLSDRVGMPMQSRYKTVRMNM